MTARDKSHGVISDLKYFTMMSQVPHDKVWIFQRRKTHNEISLIL